MAVPKELSLSEIRDFMLKNGGKVTNHELVKYFKQFLTNPNTKGEARKRFKTYVNLLSTIKNENNEKYLILRKRYYSECPVEESDELDLFCTPDHLQSPGSRSGISEHDLRGISAERESMRGAAGDNKHQQEFSASTEPPPYKAPPKVMLPIHEKFDECVDEFKSVLQSMENNSKKQTNHKPNEVAIVPKLPPKQSSKEVKHVNNSGIPESGISVQNLLASDMNENREDNENVSIASTPASESDNHILSKQISVKEATQKFNRIASEEEANKIISPSSKKRTENQIGEAAVENLASLTGHPKTKEWLVSSARSNYQELAKLLVEYPELVRLQDSTTGYTALHWAAKHGNQDVVKLIAGTYKADVNSKTNGGYTPLHLAVQFGKDHIFELLCNVYKADRDTLDWSGRKPLDYRKQSMSVSASTYNKIKARKKHSEKELGFLRIGSLNVRVKKTTEAFSNFLGVGGTNNIQYNNSSSMDQRLLRNRGSVPITHFDTIHKTWGSADNMPKDSKMLPPKFNSVKKRRTRRNADYMATTGRIGHRSVPTTPNQTRAVTIHALSEHPQTESDSDTAGFDSNWK